MHFRHIYIFLFLFLTQLCYSQTKVQADSLAKKKPKAIKVKPAKAAKDTTKKINWPDIAISPGFIDQYQKFGDINLSIGRYEKGPDGGAFGGVRLGMETNLKKGDELMYAPKIGLELFSSFVCIRLSTLYYTRGTVHQVRLLPEVGTSLWGVANLTVGYGFELTKSNLAYYAGNTRISLCINLQKDLIKNLMKSKTK
jgi:hypothetical protein